MTSLSNSPASSTTSGFLSFASLLSIGVGLSATLGWLLHIALATPSTPSSTLVRFGVMLCSLLLSLVLWELRKRSLALRAEVENGTRLSAHLQALNGDLEQRVAQRTTALGESEGRLAGIIQSAMDSILTVDARQRILMFNAAAEKMFRCPAADALGQSVERFIPQRFRAAHNGHIQRFGETGVTNRAMGAIRGLWAVRADGEEFQIEASISKIEAGGTKMFTVILRDVTERERAEATRERLAAMVDSSDDAIISKTLEGKISAWNSGAEKIFGYSAAEAVGKPILMLLPPDRVQEEADILARIRRGESVKHFETVRVRKDGTKIDVSATISPIKDQCGAIVGASKIARDITQQKRTQEELREQARLLDLAPVLGRDMESRIVLWNVGAEKLYGYSREEALNQVSHELLLTQFPEPLWRIEAKLLREDTWEGELIHQHKGGNLLVVASVWVLHRDAAGKPTRILETNTDITARKRAEEQMASQAEELSRQAQELSRTEQEVRLLNEELEQRVQRRTAELEVANKELEAFTYSVSHDLRAPLRHIAGFSSMLMEEFAETLDPEAQRYLQRIQDGTRRMGLLVDDLLNLTRIGRQELRCQVTGLDSLVKDVIEELKPDSEGRSVEWKIGGLPYVEADPSLLKQVFQNLLSNALKYSRPRNPAVIEIGQAPHNGDPVVFVRDNGVGFSMKYADKLFGVFQRLHRAEDFEGTGVGLAIAQRIVQKHGGRMWAEAELDKGATFYFTLGAAKTVEPPAQALTAGGNA